MYANNCWHFNIYEQDKFHAQLSWAGKKFYNLEAWSRTKQLQLSADDKSHVSKERINDWVGVDILDGNKDNL